MKTFFNHSNLIYFTMTKRIKVIFSTLFLVGLTTISAWAQTTYTVTNINDSGAGSLRQAIIDANSNVDFSNINFNITGTAPFNIGLLSELPTITTRVSINGFSQSGSSVSNFKVKITNTISMMRGFKLYGGSANSVVEGIEFSNFNLAIDVASAASCTIKNNLINSTIAGAVGIGLITSNNHIVTGNKIGVDVTGLIPIGVISNGINVFSATNVTIGGSAATDANHIRAVDICISFSQTSSSFIKGNLIGPDKNGNVFNNPYKISTGINLQSGSANNIIGGSGTDANIIGGTQTTTGFGIALKDAGTNNNIIKGNKIGVNASGGLIPNYNGVWTEQNAQNNIIGSTVASEANIISGNIFYGVVIGSPSTKIIGNKIGTNSAGTAAIANGSGIHVVSGCTGCEIGGTNANTRNIISGNAGSGIEVSTSMSTILNNYIGTDITGTLAVPNQIGIATNANDITIGANINTQPNLISGNSLYGIGILLGTNVQVKGNIIGTNITGTAAIPNTQIGVYVKISGHQIGTATSGEENLISGNGSNGIELNSSSTCVVKGNKIGTNLAGTSSIPNQLNGVYIYRGFGHTIGGILTGERNIIANNIGDGINVTGVTNSSGNKNLLLANNIYNNGTASNKAINLNLSTSSKGNNAKAAPTIISAAITGGNLIINGTSLSGDKIQFFLGDGGSQNANIYVSGYDYTTSSSSWTATIPASAVSANLTTYPKLLATATDVLNNTSELSNNPTVNNCDLAVTIGAVPPQYCLNATPITLTATPTGGVFSGTNVSGSTFTPSSVGPVVITYTLALSGCSTRTDQKTINVENYSNITVSPTCSFDPSTRRRWVINHPTHLNPIDLTYTISNPLDGNLRTGTITTNSSGVTYFESQASGAAPFVKLINFAANGDAIPSQSQANDNGLVYSAARGYGWSATGNTQVAAFTGTWDTRYSKSTTVPSSPGNIWKLDVPRNATYEVRLICGLQSNIAIQTNNVSIEGTVINDPDPNDDWDEYIVNVVVSDGQLTVTNAPGSVNLKFAYIEVKEIVQNTVVLKACNNQVATVVNTLASRCTISGPDLVCEASSGTAYTVQTPTPGVVGSTFVWQVNVPGGPSSASMSGTTATGTLNTLTQTGPVFVVLSELNSNYFGGGTVLSKTVYIQPTGIANMTVPSGCLSSNQKGFTSTSSLASPYTAVYNWYVGTSGSLSTNTSYTHTFASYGMYDIKLESSVRNRLCVTSKTYPYAAVPTPIFGISGGDANVCDGTTINYGSTSSNVVTDPLTTTDVFKTIDGHDQYLWSTYTGNLNTKNISVLYSNPGTSNITVGFGFTVFNSATCTAGNGGPIIIYGRPLMTQNTATSRGVSCPTSNDGVLNFNLSGGTAPYSYNIKYLGPNNTNTIIVSGSSATAVNNISASGLGAGNYVFELNDKTNIPGESCMSSFPFTIGFDGVAASVCTMFGTCSPSTNGSIKISTSTSSTSLYVSSSYSYTVTDKFSSAVVASGTVPVNATVSPLVGNDYTIPTSFPDGSYRIKLITPNGGSGCISYYDVILSRPILSTGGNYPPICNIAGLTSHVMFSPSIQRGSCSSQPLSTNYTLVVKRTSDNSTMSYVPGFPLQYDLAPGYYSCTLTETISGCSTTEDFRIAQGDPMTVSILNSKNILCLGQTNGSASILVKGGSSDISYSWVNTLNPLSPLTTKTATATDLGQGTYQVTITDNQSGCSTTSPVITIANANPIAVTASSALGSCAGTATLTSGSVGQQPYRYAWKKIMYYIPGTPPTPVTDTRYVSPVVSATSDVASNIIAGDYLVQVTDVNGCKSNEYPITITPPTARRYEICVRYKAEPKIPVLPVTVTPEPTIPNPIQTVASDVAQTIQEKVQKCLTTMENNANVNIEATCKDPEKLLDVLTIEYHLKQYQYTLYKYNRAGDLIGTVTPNGVADLLTNGTIPGNRTDATASTNTEYAPYLTTYQYNSLDQEMYENTPDGGSTIYNYDDKGHIRFSRNARQQNDNTYSYTKYDALERITETGENNNWSGAASSLAVNLANFSGYPSSGTERTFTVYSNPFTGGLVTNPFTSETQRYQRNRVSQLYRENGTDISRTYYSYDPHGNLDWLRQDVPGFASSYVAYEYDLISNKVLKIKYNEGYKDRLFHKYCYDVDNRIKEVYTSKDNIVWERDAAYDYYIHGPHSRTLIGQDKIQGLDYTYTIHGWLKGINSPDLTSGNDPGGDDGTKVATDVFGMALTYYKGDFTNNISASNVFNSSTSSTNTYKMTPIADRFNGNITAWSIQEKNPIGGGSGLMGNLYEYDRLNRLRTSRYQTYSSGWANNINGDYNTDYTYDPNGNIITLKRNGFTGATNNSMDDMLYEYYQPGTPNSKSNRLKRVNDNITDNGQGWGDIDLANNNKDYDYDALGNLVLDRREKIKITWDVYGKVKMVEPIDPTTYAVTTPSASTKPKMIFSYDATGIRIRKQVYTNSASVVDHTDYYVLNADGNMMAIYNGTASTLAVTEMGIYSGDRIGLLMPSATDGAVNLGSRNAAAADETLITRKLGYKQYELQDHLGNVTATLSDRLTKTASVLNAELYSYSNYYPFGMAMPGKLYTTATGYRYGFNGMEKNPELKSIYTTEYRQYDARLGRWFSIDPAARHFESMSPYSSMGNNPIVATDPNGDWFTVIAGAIGGAVVGAVGNVVKAALAPGKFKDNFSWKSFAKDVGKGTVIGAIAGTGCIPCAATAAGAIEAADDLNEQTKGKFLSKDIFKRSTYNGVNGWQTVTKAGIAAAFAAYGAHGAHKSLTAAGLKWYSKAGLSKSLILGELNIFTGPEAMKKNWEYIADLGAGVVSDLAWTWGNEIFKKKPAAPTTSNIVLGKSYKSSRTIQRHYKHKGQAGAYSRWNKKGADDTVKLLESHGIPAWLDSSDPNYYKVKVHPNDVPRARVYVPDAF
jgi:RHS repeat-associated protein